MIYSRNMRKNKVKWEQERQENGCKYAIKTI